VTILIENQFFFFMKLHVKPYPIILVKLIYQIFLFYIQEFIRYIFLIIDIACIFFTNKTIFQLGKISIIYTRLSLSFLTQFDNNADLQLEGLV
jgi:hypothetical protein